MARKLRLQVGDYVCLKSRYGHEPIFGKVVQVRRNSKVQMKEFGVFDYVVQFIRDSGPPDIQDGWTIKELSSGRLFYVDHDTVKVLYGKV